MAAHGVTDHDGRYVACIYGFSTLDQAVAFANRKGEGRPDPSPAVETRTLARVPVPGTTKLYRLKEDPGAAKVALSVQDLERIGKALDAIPVAGDRYTAKQQARINR